ncbi:RHS repeat protein [Escherichia coli]|nr:RHS repeat protein [Escherichia coli]
MSGKPAARQGDMTRKGLDIVQGSAGVLIGAPTGVACSVCPKKKDSPNYGNPVNPVLGAKVLPGETDIALPGPLPFILSRAYSSYRTRTPAPVGVFGPGWKAPFDIRLQIRDEGLILNDSGGRSIHFEPLFPGEVSYSRSESFWLARGGVAEQHSSQPLSALWQVLPEDVRLSPHVYLATNSLQGPWWILSWPERERDLTGWMSLSRKPEETWYGWDGDRLTTVQTQQTRIQTVYQPGSFTPLLRIETENGEQAKARHRSLAEVLQEDTGVTLPAELAVMLGRLERELRQGSVSEESQQWLAQCGLTAEQMAAQLEAEYIPERKLHLYHCDHRGLPLALISPEGETAWQGEYDEWGNLLGEESAQHLQQSLRLPGQQYDEESGLYYNRNRYYDPLQGRYITQDPIGLRGEWNLYKYPLNPVRFIDSLGLKFHVNGDPSDFNQAVEYLKQDSQMKETIDFLSSSEETINIEYIEGTNVRFNSNNMAIYWNSRASLFCSTELNSKSQSPALGLGHEFAHAQYYLLDKENFMALLSRTDKKYENKEEARVITIIESRAAKTLGECTRGAHSGLPFYRVDGPLQTMKITGTPE